MRWAGHVACMGSRRGAYRVLWGNLSERDHLEDLGTDGRIILKCFLTLQQQWTFKLLPSLRTEEFKFPTSSAPV